MAAFIVKKRHINENSAEERNIMYYSVYGGGCGLTVGMASELRDRGSIAVLNESRQ